MTHLRARPCGDHAGPPMTVALMNDYEVIVRGLERMLSPYADLIRIVELDAGMPVGRPVDLSLYDTFALSQIDSDDIDTVLANPDSGRVVVYSWNTHAELVAVARRKGVRGYLTKSSSAADLVDALQRIHAGEIVISAEPEGPQPHWEPSAGPDLWPGQNYGLSGREAEVLALIAQGLTNEQIAARMYLSINTVKTYIRSAYRKIDVTSRPNAVIWGMSHDLAPGRGRRIRVTRPTA